MSERELTLQEQVNRIGVGDQVKARFVGPSGVRGYLVEGYVWRSLPAEPLRVGRYDLLTFGDGAAHDTLSEIVEHHPKPRPYAEGTDRTAPRFGDVVELAVWDSGFPPPRYIYAPRGDGANPQPWLELHSESDAIAWYTKPLGTEWLERERLPKKLRLVQELRAPEVGDA